MSKIAGATALARHAPPAISVLPPCAAALWSATMRILAGTHEHIRLAHRAEDRDIFARGALKAALWAKDQPEGLYDMSDVLGL